VSLALTLGGILTGCSWLPDVEATSCKLCRVGLQFMVSSTKKRATSFFPHLARIAERVLVFFAKV
jgi:hypothetical protein